MIKLFAYELKRLLINKSFFTMLLIIAVYSFYILSTSTILGTAGTAPFSAWSYGAFLNGVLPLMVVILLFFVSFLYTKQEKQVQALTTATPFNPRLYRLLRLIAIAAGYTLLCAVITIISMIFYALVFRFTNFLNFIFPIIVTLVPTFLFIVGVSMLLGRKSVYLVYACMVIFPLLIALPFPVAQDLFGYSFFSTYPLALSIAENGEPLFTLPLAFVLYKMSYSVTGIGMIAASLLGCKRNLG